LIQVTVVGAAKEEERRGGLVPGQPIEGIYRVEPSGVVNLGFEYGSVSVVGKEVSGKNSATEAIREHLKKRFKIAFDVTATLAESRAMQQIRGEHLVRPDGKVTLGYYGSVYITGMTTEQAKHAIQKHLSQFLLDPEISLDIGGFNSRVYYVVFDLDGAGQQVFRLPSTGNETVMDAIAELKGLPGGTNRKKIWVARPSPADATCNQILPVDWDAIIAGGSTGTNYQLLPGDRVFVSTDPWYRADNTIAKVIAPFERILGFTLLGSTTARQFIGGVQNQNGVGP
jgi:polysaccharide export outer membrane protein